MSPSSTAAGSDMEAVLLKNDYDYVLVIDPALKLICKEVTEIFHDYFLEDESVETSIKMFQIMSYENIKYLLQE